MYQNWTSEFIEKGSVGRAQVLFALAWFHTIIQERRNFMPQGWTKFYEFSAADLRSTAELISVSLEIFYRYVHSKHTDCVEIT